MGRFHILFATMRGVYLALAIVLTQQRYDVLFVDQLSSPIPILRLCGSRIIFYCHFPDLALSGRRDGLKRVYRVLFDAVEEWTTLMAHDILVNSHFTAGVFKSTFRNTRGVSPQVLHPCINTAAYDTAPLVEQGTELSRTVRGHVTLVSINRFERKKNIALALHALGLLKDKMAQLHQGGGKGGCAGPAFGDVRLVIAGGYDGRVRENVEYMLELRALADRLGIKEQVVFLPSFSEEERGVLLRHAAGVVYTPHNEHFGIVPLEAMYAGRPVIACSSGGPLESIVHGTTGWLCEGTAETFANAYLELVQSPERAAEMGRAGRQRVAERFSLPAFARRLSRLVSGPPGTLLDPPQAFQD